MVKALEAASKGASTYTLAAKTSKKVKQDAFTLAAMVRFNRGNFVFR
jgi:hypothetical protein